MLRATVFRLPQYPKIRSRTMHDEELPGWRGNSILYPEMDQDLQVPPGEELRLTEYGVTLTSGTQVRLQYWKDSYFLFAGPVIR